MTRASINRDSPYFLLIRARIEGGAGKKMGTVPIYWERRE
jgi:hypothetical protein